MNKQHDLICLSDMRTVCRRPDLRISLMARVLRVFVDAVSLPTRGETK